MPHWNGHAQNWEIEQLVHRAIRDTQTPEQPKPQPNPELPPERRVTPGVLPPIEPHPEPQNPMPAPQPKLPDIQGTPRLREIRSAYQPAMLTIFRPSLRLHSPHTGRSLL